MAPNTTDKPIAVTPGDPAGIGGEITLRAHHSGVRGFFVLNEVEHLDTVSKSIGLSTEFREIDGPGSYDPACTALQVSSLNWAQPPIAGTPSPENAPLIIGAIEAAARWAQTGACAAMVTNPIAKAPLYEAGFIHPGHTEFLGSLAPEKPGAPLMMLACDELRVVPVTVHIPLADVPKKLTTSMIVDAGRLLADNLRINFGIPSPRLAVCGLNPHAGEGGKMGREDIDIIAPAISQLQADGIDAYGPVPADTMFHEAARSGYDAALGMYHDQVLIPLKTLDFFGGVNVTLGLDFIRTSPDHGTGFDIAGKGVAKADSLIAAIEMAKMMAIASHA